MNKDVMVIKKLRLTNFRNLRDARFEPCEGVNVLFGQNAQGKTNTLEAIWLFTGLRSFRVNKFKSLISFNEDFARLECDFIRDGADHKAVITVTQDVRKLSLDGIDNIEPVEYMGSFNAVVFTPSSLSLIDGPPDDRRRFLDNCICQQSREYSAALTQFRRALRQRNAALKSAPDDETAAKNAALWNASLAAPGQRIMDIRQRFMDDFKDRAAESYYGLSGGRERMEIGYSVRRPDDLDGDYYDLLEAQTVNDAVRRTTCWGPHRDDLKITVDGRSVRLYGSQGQKRSCAISMKLSEADAIRANTGRTPVIILDDVLSELDTSRQEYVLSKCSEGQMFISCCEPTQALKNTGGRIFSVKGGEIS